MRWNWSGLWQPKQACLPSAFSMCGALVPCGSWHWMHLPLFSTGWTFGLSIPTVSRLWQEKQRLLPACFSASLGTMPWRRWQSSHLRCLTAPCVNFSPSYFSANFLWHSVQSLPFIVRNCACAPSGAASRSAAKSAGREREHQKLGRVTTLSSRYDLLPAAGDEPPPYTVLRRRGASLQLRTSPVSYRSS